MILFRLSALLVVSQAFSPVLYKGTSRNLLFATKDDDDVPFFMRDDIVLEEEPSTPKPRVVTPAVKMPDIDIDEVVAKTSKVTQAVTEKTNEIGGKVAEQLSKVDWDDVRSKAKAVTESDEVKTLQKTGVQVLGATWSALGDFSKAVIEKQKERQAEAAKAEVMAKNDDVEAILQQAEDAVALAEGKTVVEEPVVEEEPKEEASLEAVVEAAAAETIEETIPPRVEEPVVTVEEPSPVEKEPVADNPVAIVEEEPVAEENVVVEEPAPVSTEEPITLEGDDSASTTDLDTTDDDSSQAPPPSAEPNTPSNDATDSI